MKHSLKNKYRTESKNLRRHIHFQQCMEYAYIYILYKYIYIYMYVYFIYIKNMYVYKYGLLWMAQMVKICLQCRRPRFYPCVGRSLGRGHGNPLLCSCLENSHELRSQAGYSPQDNRVGHYWSTLPCMTKYV